MKVKRTETKEFKPVTLEITLETADELRAMYHRLYIDVDDVNDASGSDRVGKVDESGNGDIDCADAFKAVRAIAIECGVRE